MATNRLNSILRAVAFATLGVAVCSEIWIFYSGLAQQRAREYKTKAAPTPSHSCPQWAPDKNVALRLSHRIELKDGNPHLVIDVPPEYSAQVAETAGNKTLLLRGPQRKDGTQSVFIVSCLPNRGVNDKKGYTLSEGFPLYLAAIKNGRRENWHETKYEEGQVNGLPFIRAQWSGTEPVSKKLMRGFLYGTVMDDQFIVMSAQDFEQYVPHVLPTLNASALTLKLIK